MSTAPIPAPVTTAPVAKVVNKRRLSDGAWAITLRVNGDPTTDTVHTFYADHSVINGGTVDPVSWLADRKAKVVARHTAMAALDAQIPNLE